jgi:galactokinase
MESGNWLVLGNLMNASHESMKVDYETSCMEIDRLVDLAQGFEGVYGSRLTGGGFGGCTVSLVRRNVVDKLCEYMKTEYKAQTGLECSCFVTQAGPGAREIHL